MTIGRIVLLLVTIAAILYGSHVRSADWVYEDVKVVQRGAQESRPVTAWTWQFTQTPQAAHALSLALHMAVAALAGLLAFRLGLSSIAAWWTVALVLVQPMAVEATAYAASRGELIAAFGVLIACIAVTLQTSLRWPLVALGLMIGIGGKESAVMGAVLVPVTAYAARARISVDGWVLYGISLFVAVLAFLSVIDPNRIGIAGFVNYGEAGIMVISAPDWVLLQATAAWRLLLVTITGVGMTADADYDRLTIATRAGALLACIGFAGFALNLWRTRPRIAFGLTWAILSLLLRFVIQTPRSILPEHQVYLALPGLIIAGIATWDAWQQREPAW